MGNDGYVENFFKAGENFNPRSLVGNDKVLASSSGFSPNFNPRSLVGNDLFSYNPITISFVISIHVPSWGTTRCSADIANCICISIHVPSWGTTAFRILLLLYLEYFNPRSLVGNDDYLDSFGMLEYISIHVPSWGTT